MFDEEVDVVYSDESYKLYNLLDENLIKFFQLEDFKKIKSSSKHSFDLIINILSAFVPPVQLVNIVKSSFDIRTKIFYDNLDGLFEGVSKIPFKDRQNFFKKFETEFSNNSERILNSISNIDNRKKIHYVVILISRLVDEKIDFTMFFRLVDVIERCLFEDLELFLREVEFYKLNGIVIESLLNLGLIYDKASDPMSQIVDENGELSITLSPDYINDKYYISKRYDLSILGKELKKQLNSEVNYEQ